MGILDELMRKFAPPIDPRVEALENMTRLQRDLAMRAQRGETLEGQDANNLLNRSNPPEYKGLPEDEDDIFGY